MPAEPRVCSVRQCENLLDPRNTSGKCRPHANAARSGTPKQSEAARVAAEAKWARVAEDRRLADLARAAGLG